MHLVPQRHPLGTGCFLPPRLLLQLLRSESLHDSCKSWHCLHCLMPLNITFQLLSPATHLLLDR